MVTCFKDIRSKDPIYMTLDQVLDRIRSGKSKVTVEMVRSAPTKDQANALKEKLVSVLFSGKFSGRNDKDLLEHSGHLVLDFDGVYDVAEKKQQLTKYAFIRACWISPSGKGVKALVNIKY